MFSNVVIGKPLLQVESLLAIDKEDWEANEKNQTLFTETRFLPAVMKEAGIVESISEVKRNRLDYVVELTKPDCLQIKWGKKFLYIVVGE